MKKQRASWTVFLPIIMVVAFFLGWTAYVRIAGISPFILPEPLAIFTAFIALVQEDKIWTHVGVTLLETLSGFGLAILVGVSLGVVMGKVRAVEVALKPFVVATQVIPKIALVPLFILWFGFGPESKIVISAVLAFFPIFSNTLLGIKSVDAGYKEVMTVFEASRFSRFAMLELPSALPFILTGMEIGIVLSIIGAIVGEFVGGNVGLGYLSVVTLQELQVDTLFAVVLLLTMIGLSLYVMVSALRRLLVPWHGSASAGQ